MVGRCCSRRLKRGSGRVFCRGWPCVLMKFRRLFTGEGREYIHDIYIIDHWGICSIWWLSFDSFFFVCMFIWSMNICITLYTLWELSKTHTHGLFCVLDLIYIKGWQKRIIHRRSAIPIRILTTPHSATTQTTTNRRINPHRRLSQGCIQKIRLWRPTPSHCLEIWSIHRLYWTFGLVISRCTPNQWCQWEDARGGVSAAYHVLDQAWWEGGDWKDFDEGDWSYCCEWRWGGGVYWEEEGGWKSWRKEIDFDFQYTGGRLAQGKFSKMLNDIWYFGRSFFGGTNTQF